MSYNHATLIGRLTKAPELSTTPNGKSVCSFNIAVDRDYTDKDGNRKTDFFTVVTWGSVAEFVTKWFNKGQWIGTDGSFEVRKYTDKNGNERTATELKAARCFFVGDKQNNTAQQEESNTGDFSPLADDNDEGSDLPF